MEVLFSTMNCLTLSKVQATQDTQVSKMMTQHLPKMVYFKIFRGEPESCTKGEKGLWVAGCWFSTLPRKAELLQLTQPTLSEVRWVTLCYRCDRSGVNMNPCKIFRWVFSWFFPKQVAVNLVSGQSSLQTKGHHDIHAKETGEVLVFWENRIDQHGLVHDSRETRRTSQAWQGV